MRAPPDGLLVTPNAWSKQPWKNGRGVTHEIWRWIDPTRAPAEPDGGFDLRLSVARIDGPQEFSLFPGYWRALIPLDDCALTLGGAPLTKHHGFQFPGDVPMSTAGSGTTRDLNVMSRIARARAHVEVSTSETHRHSPAIWPLARARHLAVFALEPVTLRDVRGSERTLGASETLIHLDHAGDVAFTASAPVVWIRF